MNICEYILKNNIPHTKGKNGTIVQKGFLDLRHKKITSLDNFIQNGTLYLEYNQITNLDNFIQSGWLDLSFNQITNLDNFIQNGDLFLDHNQITNLDNFVQNGDLYLRHNKITSLDNFIQNGILYLCTWGTKLKGNILTIGCKSKSLEDWDEFFKLKKSYETDPNSEKYMEIEKVFKLYKNKVLFI